MWKAPSFSARLLHAALPREITADWAYQLCLSEIKSGHIRDAIRQGLGGKEYALPSLRDRGASSSKAKCVRVSL
jgi:hypothetical protein